MLCGSKNRYQPPWRVTLSISNMAAGGRSDWKGDISLQNDLEAYVKKNLKRAEVLDFVKEKYPMYEWSLRTLCRRLNHFGIKYIDYTIDISDVENAVREEISGPGRLLGYRAMQQKVRELHGLKVPRGLVHDVMTEVDHEGLKARGNVGRPKKQRKKGAFTAMGSDWTLSLDGHDKLCGYQKATFPLCIYGGLDTYSNRINFLRVWTSNNNPKVVGLFYFEYLYECRVLPARIRIDKGTETVELAAIHAYLLDKQGYGTEEASDAVIYGPSTENKIERWWKELHERMEGFFKDQLKILIEDGDYERDNKLHRDLLAFVYIPVIQRELDVFRETVWNSHRGRKQKNKDLPTGIPEHIYHFPEHYGGEKCGFPISEEHLEEVAEVSDIFEGTDDYLDPELREQCEALIPEPKDIKSSEAANAYLYLRENITTYNATV